MTIFLIFTSVFIGSFLGLLIMRIPLNRPIILARSRCDRCGKALLPLDMIPLVSWTVLRGRCRSCGAWIGWFYPAIEIAALLVALSVLAMLGEASLVTILSSLALGWGLLTLAVIDARCFLLPNCLTLPLLALGLIHSSLLGEAAWKQSWVGALLGYAIFSAVDLLYFRIRRIRGMGGGDARLLAVAGAWVGAEGLPTVILLAALTGLLQALWLQRRGIGLTSRTKLPFGPGLALGIWVTWLLGPLVAQFTEDNARIVGALIAFAI
jgi:leader peptidase (prepilin peptidase)/N-methyltransferase